MYVKMVSMRDNCSSSIIAWNHIGNKSEQLTPFLALKGPDSCSQFVPVKRCKLWHSKVGVTANESRVLEARALTLVLLPILTRASLLRSYTTWSLSVTRYAPELTRLFFFPQTTIYCLSNCIHLAIHQLTEARVSSFSQSVSLAALLSSVTYTLSILSPASQLPFDLCIRVAHPWLNLSFLLPKAGSSTLALLAAVSLPPS